MSKTVTRASDVPDSHKIAVYEALRRYFEGALGDYYTSPLPPADPRYDSGMAEERTECVGIEVHGDELYIVMAIEGWADLHGFAVAPPALTRDDHQDDGTVLTLAIAEESHSERARSLLARLIDAVAGEQEDLEELARALGRPVVPIIVEVRAWLKGE